MITLLLTVLLVLLITLLAVLVYQLQNLKRSLNLTEQEFKQLQNSIDSLDVGFAMVDKTKKIVSINGHARRVLCSSPASSPVGSLHSPLISNAECNLEDIQKKLQGVLDIKSHIDHCFTTNSPIKIKEVIIASRYYQVTLNPIIVLDQTSNLEVQGVVVLLEDKTEAVLLEKSKDEFFSIASHELRTPLTAVRGNASILQKYYPNLMKDPDVKEMISDIYGASTRLINIVNDFLNVSRLEQKRMNFKKENFNLLILIKKTMTELIKSAAEKGLYLRLGVDQNIDIDQFWASADPDKTQEVLINLIGNAIKYTDSGGVVVSLKKEAGFLKVSVYDTGLGIPETNRKLLFGKFQQASNNTLTRDSRKSTGLGLYISKLMVEGMHGEIALESSEEGKGSTFSFILPQGLPIASTVATPKPAEYNQNYHPI